MGLALIKTARFTLRSLTVDDATKAYSQWFDDPAVAEHIMAAKAPHDIDALRRYIAEKSILPDVLFLGIFELDSGTHIGNIKYEPIDSANGVAEMGILIGEPNWRGRGVAREIIVASADWLRKHRGISRILLGVEKKNLAALSAYLRTGFRQTEIIRDPRVEGEILRMALEIKG